jgi:hypothetical protein
MLLLPISENYKILLRDENNGFYLGWLDLLALRIQSLSITFNAALSLIYTFSSSPLHTHFPLVVSWQRTSTQKPSLQIIMIFPQPAICHKWVPWCLIHSIYVLLLETFGFWNSKQLLLQLQQEITEENRNWKIRFMLHCRLLCTGSLWKKN